MKPNKIHPKDIKAVKENLYNQEVWHLENLGFEDINEEQEEKISIRVEEIFNDRYVIKYPINILLMPKKFQAFKAEMDDWELERFNEITRLIEVFHVTTCCKVRTKESKLRNDEFAIFKSDFKAEISELKFSNDLEIYEGKNEILELRKTNFAKEMELKKSIEKIKVKKAKKVKK